MKFRRKFSVVNFKNLKYKLGEMSFSKDWVTETKRGDPYPILEKGEGITEKTGNGRYLVVNNGAEKARVRRFIGGFTPFGSHALDISALENGKVGFAFVCRGGDGSDFTPENAPYAEIFVSKEDEKVSIGYKVKGSAITEGVADYSGEILGKTLVVTARYDFFDVYLISDGNTEVVCHVQLDTRVDGRPALHYKRNIDVTEICVFAELNADGRAEIKNAEWYLDSGVGQADMRPVRYEDGTPIIENGRIYLTMSIRLALSSYQGIVSWNPTGCDFRLEGALFFDVGDGFIAGDVATSLIYNRKTDKWMLWYCSFSHGHILAHGESIADPRFGINIIDGTLMQSESKDAAGKSLISDDKLFFAKDGDEDPEFIYDEERGKWILGICRLVRFPAENNRIRYRYFFYESDSPFDGYKYIGNSNDGENTGGSIVKTDHGYRFVCGSDFSIRARYINFDLYNLEDHEDLQFDYDDGGFRGWGSVFRFPCGSRYVYKMITFDRHNGSPINNWSYGNIHVFEADEF